MIEGMELTLDTLRLYIIKIDDLYLLTAAERHSGETEKVRIVQAAEMIRKSYRERYKAGPKKAAQEESYVPSFS